MLTLFTQNINCSLRARVRIVRANNTDENVTQQALLLYVELTFSYFSVSLSEVAYTKKLLGARKQHAISWTPSFLGTPSCPGCYSGTGTAASSAHLVCCFFYVVLRRTKRWKFIFSAHFAFPRNKFRLLQYVLRSHAKFCLITLRLHLFLLFFLQCHPAYFMPSSEYTSASVSTRARNWKYCAGTQNLLQVNTEITACKRKTCCEGMWKYCMRIQNDHQK